MKIITRSEAKAAGLKRYFTGKPCLRGHISERHVEGTCMQCQREDKAAAYKADPKGFRDRSTAAYRRRNDGNLRHQLPRQTEEERLAKLRNAVRAHYANNKPYYMARSQERRAKKLAAMPGWFGELDRLVMTEAARLVQSRRDATGICWQADHMIPLAASRACGLHVATNIQVIPARMNKAKGNKMIFTNPGEWIRHV